VESVLAGSKRWYEICFFFAKEELKIKDREIIVIRTQLEVQKKKRY